MIGRIDDHLSNCTEGIAFRFNGKKRSILICGSHQFCVHHTVFVAGCDPVGLVETPDMAFDIVLFPSRQLFPQFILTMLRPFGPPLRYMAASKGIFGYIIEFAKQLTFPAIPDIWADGPDVGNG